MTSCADFEDIGKCINARATAGARLVDARRAKTPDPEEVHEREADYLLCRIIERRAYAIAGRASEAPPPEAWEG